MKKYIVRRVVLPTMLNLGVDRAVRAFADHSILNVMYHGVVKENHNYFTPRHITAEQFEKHLIYFKQNFDIVSIAEAFEMYRNNIVPKRKTITITFDDGYNNNLFTAVPILEKHNIKATFFILGVCTKDMDIRALWADIIASLRYFYKDSKIEIDGHKFENFYNKSLNMRVRDYLKVLPYEKRDVVVEELIQKYHLKDKINQIPDEAWKLLTNSELLKFAKSKSVEIGSHGYLHFNMGNIDAANVKRELIVSKELLEEVINRPVSQIAYPDGSYNRDVIDAAEKAGYKNQLAVNYLCDEDKSDPRILNRHGVSSTTTHESNMLSINRAFSPKGYN